MRFFVRIEAQVPADLDPVELDRLNAAETARGRELVAVGAIEQIWRIGGRRANVGIWSADSRENLDALIDSLPMRAFVEVAEVEVLEPHPVASASSHDEGCQSR